MSESFQAGVRRYCRARGLSGPFDRFRSLPACITGGEGFGRWKDLVGRLDWLYRRLADERSRDWLVRLFCHQVLREKEPDWTLPPADPEKAPWADRGEEVSTGFRDLRLHRYDLSGAGFDVELFLPRDRPNALFDLEQYADRDNGVFVRPGDRVIDGGGCWGDSALYFASQAGPEGRVLTFEFLPSNLELLRRNLSLNPRYEEVVEVVEAPLWKDTETTFLVSEDGPATRVHPVGEDDESEGLRVKGVCIDSLVESGRIDRVDFIKMDIEGAEPRALAGARDVIRRFRPDLALCVYHCPKDYVRLAEVVHRWVPEYRFSLGHFSDNEWETVLFATVRG